MKQPNNIDRTVHRYLPRDVKHVACGRTISDRAQWTLRDAMGMGTPCAVCWSSIARPVWSYERDGLDDCGMDGN